MAWKTPSHFLSELYGELTSECIAIIGVIFLFRVFYVFVPSKVNPLKLNQHIFFYLF